MTHEEGKKKKTGEKKKRTNLRDGSLRCGDGDEEGGAVQQPDLEGDSFPLGKNSDF
jgi:hypothetical protein